MGTKSNPLPGDCYDRAMPDEPMFILLGRDPSAPEIVRQWAKERAAEVGLGKRPVTDITIVEEAFSCAKAMERWREANDGAWRKQSPVLGPSYQSEKGFPE